MATPTRNYSVYGFGKMPPDTMILPSIPSAVFYTPPMSNVFIPTEHPSLHRVPWVVCVKPTEHINQSHFPPVPTPPNGRQIILTFPVVYFRKPTRPRKGQLWPRTR